MGQLHEFEFIDWIRGRAAADARVLTGIGDDTAVLASPATATLLTTDMLVDGVHFDLGHAEPRDVGWKALACSISDIAAMGGRSTVAVASTALPHGTDPELAKGLVLGLLECGDAYGVSLVGGDLTGTEGPLVLNVALLGELVAEKAVLRSGARVGDALLVTGALGGSLLGRHLRVRPRAEEGIALARDYHATAMIDISDGLARDLHHILHESGVGVRVDAAAIPVSDDARRMATSSGRTPLAHALGDGEDFELLFTLAPADAERLLADSPFTTPVTRIGSITDDGAVLVLADGSETALECAGWEHEV
ncbi:thiamine-phosphate kinase [bacterium]|nr:thiamine-phosphate kinase [bacterium]